MTDLLNYTSGYKKKWNSALSPQPQESRTSEQENSGQIPEEKDSPSDDMQ